MKRHRSDHHAALPRQSRWDELAALRRDIAFTLGVIGDVLRGRPFSS